MPRLEHDGQQELQALVAIRQILEPLISRRIDDDSEKITSLAVSNSRALFKFELAQILLNVSKEQDLEADEYASFLDDFHRLLQLFEGLVDENVLRSSVDSYTKTDLENASPPAKNMPSANSTVKGLASLIYPRLAALIKAAADDHDPSRLSGLLRLPEAEEDCKVVEKTLTDFNAKNLSRSNTASRDNVGSIEVSDRSPPKPSIKPTQRIQQFDGTQGEDQNLLAVMDALRSNIRDTKCPDFHIARLQIRGLHNSSVDLGIQYKLYLTCSSIRDKWQEITCTVVHDLPSNCKLKNVKKICKDVQRALEEYQLLDIMVHSCQILRYSKSDMNRTKVATVWPTVSLESIIANIKDQFTPVDRVILAMNLARGFQRMYNAKMQSKEWNTNNIFFLFNPKERIIYEAYNPYFAYSLQQTDTFTDDEPERSRKFAILITFAKLLLEIALGMSLGPFTVPRDIALLELIGEESEAAETVAKGYLDAIAACLVANKRRIDDDSDSESDCDTDDGRQSQNHDQIDENSQCRAVISKVVVCLEEARSTLKSRKDPNFPKTLKVSNDVQSQRLAEGDSLASPTASVASGSKTMGVYASKQEGMNIAMSQNEFNLGSPTQLFDVRKMVFNPGDDRIFRADRFLTQAKDFYSEHIQNLSNERRIRIAVLDTGISENHSFFRGLKRTRRMRDSPFKLIQSFTGNSDCSDTFGHGTNVASLILKIAPEANLYIAKISNGQEEEGAKPIVEAIKWAMSPNVNVDIISMSFAFLNDQLSIKEAIKNAEKEGVIFFAAASNYGGNTPRLFPAKLLDKVLCIHASDGDGNKSGMDPTPKPFSENLSTLGVAIPSITEPDVFVSGTSYSTPIMVGIAANVLRFVQHVTSAGLMTEEQRVETFTRMGIRNILIAMSDVRDKYNYVTPWRKMWNTNASVGDVVSKIKEALKE